MRKTVKCFFIISIVLLAGSCTFDYGGGGTPGEDMPDLIMIDVEYVRVRSADPIAWFHADLAERYEKQGIMKLQNIVFEHYNEYGEEVSVYGKAGNAVVDIDSGDIFMNNGVRIEIMSEEITLDTYQLEWKDEQRYLSAGETNEVYIYREDGGSITGIGFSADARRRTWEFSNRIRGTYINEE